MYAFRDVFLQDCSCKLNACGFFLVVWFLFFFFPIFISCAQFNLIGRNQILENLLLARLIFFLKNALNKGKLIHSCHYVPLYHS